MGIQFSSPCMFFLLSSLACLASRGINFLFYSLVFILFSASAEPPVDMEFIPSNDQYQLHRHNHRHYSKEHNIHIRLSDSYLSSMEHRDVVEGHLVAGMSWRPGYPQYHVLISPVCFLSSKGQVNCELCVSLPHALYTLEDSNNRISIFSAPCVSSAYSPDRRELTLDGDATNISIDRTYVTFTITLRQPTVFAVGVATESPSFHGTLSPFDYPLLSLRCCLYIAYPSDKDKYLMSTDIKTYVGLNLRTVDQVKRNLHCVTLSNFLLLFRLFRSLLFLMISLWKRSRSIYLDRY